MEKLNLAKSYGVKILDKLTAEYRKQNWLGNFDQCIHENVAVIDNWLKSQEEEVRSNILQYPLELLLIHSL